MDLNAIDWASNWAERLFLTDGLVIGHDGAVDGAASGSRQGDEMAALLDAGEGVGGGTTWHTSVCLCVLHVRRFPPQLPPEGVAYVLDSSPH